MNTIRNKKGFTIIELVVVIAVIAILAAVLIPTFASLVQKANVSVDIQLIRNLNAVLATDAASNGKHPTLFDANETLKESGYDITKIKLSTEDAQLLWDSKNDVFCYYAGDGNAPEYVPEIDNAEKPDFENAKHTYFAIYEHMPETQTFSIYYNGTEAINANVKVGFDAGVSAASVTVETDEAISVIIRTSYTKAEDGSFAMGNLTVKAPKGDIKHYGTVNELKVISTDPENCYHEYGYVGELVKDSFLPATEESGTDVGKFIAENAKFHQTETEIKTITEYKHFEVVNAAYGQHFFGTDGNELKCVVGCDATNPEHTCTPGKMETRLCDANNKKSDTDVAGHSYIDVYCGVCMEFMYSLDQGEQGGSSEGCNHESTAEHTQPATCTKDGMKYNKCTSCGAITDMQTIPALGHDMQTQTQAQAATCTAAGHTESKKCSRCDHTTGGDNIPALGHDYKHGTCTRCSDTLSAITIKNGIIAAVQPTENKNIFTQTNYSTTVDTITFGYKEDYINKINGTHFDCSVADVEIIGVLKKNSECDGISKSYYNDQLKKDSTYKDERQYLIDLYVLSDHPIKYDYDVHEYGLFTFYGLGIVDETYNTLFVPTGAVKYIKFENFDTSDTNCFVAMFNVCQIEKIDISGFEIKDSATLYNDEGSGIFDGCVTNEVVCPEGWAFVSFNTMGGRDVNPRMQKTGEKLEAPNPPTKFNGKQALTFKGWYKDAECTQTWNQETDTVQGNMMLYAGWEVPQQ